MDTGDHVTTLPPDAVLKVYFQSSSFNNMYTQLNRCKTTEIHISVVILKPNQALCSEVLQRYVHCVKRFMQQGVAV